MKILVPIKQVMDVELNIRVQNGQVAEDGMAWVMSKWDETALEAALRLKDVGTATEVLVATVGGEHSHDTLRKALAMGADRAVAINAAPGADPLVTARLLAALAQKEAPRLVITGLQAQDTDTGGVGPMLAQLLAMPCATNVVGVEPLTADAATLTVHRRGDVGRETVELTLPACITANDSLNEARLASLKGIMAAKKKPLDVLDAAALGVDAALLVPQVEVATLASPPKRAAGRKFEGEPAQTAQQVVDLLAKEAKVFG